MSCCCFKRRKASKPEIRRVKDVSYSYNSTLDKEERSRYSILLTGYNQNLEIPWTNLQIDFSDTILSGVFTVYFKAKLKSTSRNVMVKTLKPNSAISYFKGLVRELKIISALNAHQNIVQLIGAVTQHVHLREIYIAMEFCELGTLENNLRNHREGFVNKFPREDDQPPTLPRKISQRVFPELQPKQRLNTIDLLSWGIDIANGMEYLGSHRLLHWELAARSVFISANGVAKIGDFHSLRRLDPGKEFIILTETDCPLPWKWMALESLYTSRFSLKTDVWTYGITLWEIFSLGADPFLGASLDSGFLSELSNGRRPMKPRYASNELHSLMSLCWAPLPQDRPTFSQIIAVLAAIRSNLSVIPYIP